MDSLIVLRDEPRRAPAAFTLVELLVSLALLTFIMLILVGVTEAASRAWREGQSRTETFQSARTALEILTREITPAVVDTRMQFVVAPGEVLTRAGAKNVAPDSPALVWMAPLGDEGSLSCVGYYLSRDDARQFYRLKRIFIPAPTTAKASPYFPRMVSASDPRDPELRTSPVNADWFTRSWDTNAFDEENTANSQVVVSSAADGIVAFWAQPLDVLGHPVPLVAKSSVHPSSELYYNSAAYFQVATSTPFENGRSLLYLAQTPQTMKANRVPAAIDFTLVTIDSRILARRLPIPQQTNVYDANGALDVEASVQAFNSLLQKNRIFNARTFSTRAKLVNGS
ncbi:MAG TPA: prepilin-type N-terminal cleavage/methylation domain-containing protein [Chthoniobacter sp.]|nr:prepilin-type N-terminal cleavage/methylation domain-containing protein [Chthoniobacter sp.]